MPIYEYQCRACDGRFELLVLGSETPTCPECESTDVERQLSLPSVSSEGTRKRNLAGAKAKAKKLAEEKAHADHEAAHHHHH